jgi:hypothetical protein
MQGYKVSGKSSDDRVAMLLAFSLNPHHDKYLGMITNIFFIMDLAVSTISTELRSLLHKFEGDKIILLMFNK